MSETSPVPSRSIVDEKENIENVSIAIHQASPAKVPSGTVNTFTKRPKPTPTSANVGNTRVARAHKSSSGDPPSPDKDATAMAAAKETTAKDRFLSPSYSPLTSSLPSEDRDDSTNSTERDRDDIFLPSPKISPRVRGRERVRLFCCCFPRIVFILSGFVRLQCSFLSFF
jgi:hypothetical protein